MCHVAALALTISQTPALAQSQSWTCEEGVRDLTGQLPTVLVEYQMVLNGDGTFRARGVVHAVGMQHPYEAQGQWHLNGNMFRKAGYRQDTLNGARPIELNLTIAAEGRMHDTTQSGNAVFAAQCQRMQ